MRSSRREPRGPGACLTVERDGVAWIPGWERDGVALDLTVSYHRDILVSDAKRFLWACAWRALYGSDRDASIFIWSGSGTEVPFMGLPLLHRMITAGIILPKGGDLMPGGRNRATMHCRDCRYHAHQGTPRAPHFCWYMNPRKMSFDQTRTSPDWCPLGHHIPGVSYPTFTPGKDPVMGPGTRIVER